jgi:lysozyme family protein
MKLKINGKNFSFFFLISIATLVGSCVVEESFTENDFSMDQSLIREAEEWYGSNLLASNNARINSLVEGNPVWGKSKTQLHKGKQVIEVPVKLKVKNIFAQSDKEFKNRSGDYRLLLFKIGEEQFRPYLLKVEVETPEFKSSWKDLKKLSLSTIPIEFNGKFLFFEFSGKFVGSWEIHDGEKVRSLSFKAFIEDSKNIGKINSRVLGWNYHCTIMTFTEYIQAGDADPEIVVQFEVWDCEYSYIPESVAPPAQVPGTGGEDPGCYEPHPDFEGFMIPCDDPDPCNNFEDLVDKVLNSEGGFVNDPVDRGGATNKGISWETWQNAALPILGKDPTIENLQNITAENAKSIYKAKYWNSIRLSEIEDGDLRWLIFDFHVNSGPNAMYQLQILLNGLGANLTVDGIIGSQTLDFINNYNDQIALYNLYKEKRISYLENIVTKSVNKYLAKNPNATESELKSKTQLRFKDGWLARVNEFVEKTQENYLNVNC